MSITHFASRPIKIKVVGIGGGGGNAITRMVREQIRGVEFIAMNTDIQHLGIMEAPLCLALGEKLTHGSGAGGDQDKGRKCAEESFNEIKQAIAGADMVFLAAGMGGGTGTGAIPVVAEIARQGGALVIGIVTKPFTFEGRHRMQVAEEGISRLTGKADTLIIIPNDRLLKLPDQKESLNNTFGAADEILCQAVRAITEMITVPGLINIDFAAIRNVMKDAGPGWISIGSGTGQNRAIEAAKEAISSPLIDVSISKATKVVFKFTGSSLTLFEVNAAAKLIQKSIRPEANIVFGVTLDSNLGDTVKLTLIATGFISSVASDGAVSYEEIKKLLKN